MNLDLKNRQQLLTILAVLVVGLWAGDKLILSPLVQSWKARSARIVELRKTVAKGHQLLERETAVRSRWNGMRTNTLPAEVSAAEGRVLKAFDEWSQQSRISITSIKPQWKRNAEEYVTLECRVDASGSLGTIARFLYEIENDPLALKVEAVELSTRDNDGSQIALGLQVSGLLLNQTQP